MPEPAYMLYTDVCIDVQRRKSPEMLARFASLVPGEAVVSVITWGELTYGAAKSGSRDRVLSMLDEFAVLVPVLPMPPECGNAYGAIRAALERKGIPIGNNDLWIAAHALSAGLTLVTSNMREFRRVPGLRVENWR